MALHVFGKARGERDDADDAVVVWWWYSLAFYRSLLKSICPPLRHATICTIIPFALVSPWGGVRYLNKGFAPVGGFSEQTKENGCVGSTGGRLFCGMLAGRHKNVTVVKERSLSLLLRSFGKNRLIRHQISPISV